MGTEESRFWLSLWFLGKTKRIQDSQPLFKNVTCPLKLYEYTQVYFLFFFLCSSISHSGFYRIVPFNEDVEKLIFPSVAPLIAIHLIKLHGIFNLASWASILT